MSIKFHSQAERDLVMSDENLALVDQFIKAILAHDRETCNRLIQQIELPLHLLKTSGAASVKRRGMKITTAKLANDTAWLK